MGNLFICSGSEEPWASTNKWKKVPVHRTVCKCVYESEREVLI